ncbi:MAG: 16S rRNA (guanine(527)-N(7))-methyltransferase RsmG [Planctomycetes bacterium]|nr:16S rRNA (guanine(527)-N(7))-methyltransferase RsmG [Planctomycetota bacterium]
MTPDDVAAACAAAGVEVDDDGARRLASYAGLLLAANERTNLTRITAPRDVLVKHVIDALLGLPFLAPPVVDVGSGGGVPGLVLACVRPEWPITLVESLSRKTSFLRQAAEELRLGAVEVCTARAEALGQGEGRARFRCATLRAVSSVSTCLELGLPLVEVGGGVLLYRGPEVEGLDAAERVAQELGGGALTRRAHTLPDGSARTLLWIEKRSPTPPRYPRRDGVPAKRPLS